MIAATGRTVVGLDYSADQLRIARSRSRRIVRGDAAILPFAEAARVLMPGGLLVFYGVHPCFNGPHVQWLDDGGIRAHPTYRLSGWHEPAPWWGEYVRKRVGMRHHSLAELLNAFISTGLAIERIAEMGDRPVPVNLGIRARKPRR